MINIIKRHWPLIAATGVLLSVVVICLTLSIRQNQGHLVYVLDDPYIHMAMAKNLAQHGIWGITKYGFASSSSSLLWTLVLSSVYFLFGINETSPFILNILFAILVCILVHILLRGHKLQSLFSFAALLSIIFFTPLTALIFCGQEHTLHLLLSIAFVYLSAKILSNEKPSLPQSSLLLILAPLLTMTRYEGLFLVIVTGFLFVVRRKRLYALSLGGLGILPIIIYGVISLSKGWYFLPNPVLLKSNMPNFSSLEGMARFLGGLGYYRIAKNPHILALILGALTIFYLRYSRQKKVWTESMIMIIIFVTTTLLHVQFAGTGWFYRYEAYLVGLGIFVMVISLREYFPEKLKIKIDKKPPLQYVTWGFIILIVLSPFVLRGVISLISIPQATKNIYEQQYQMGLFLREFYQQRAVAANDVGAINYLADIKCLDLWGLGNIEVGRARKKRHYNSQRIDELARSEHVEIAMLYDHWFKGPGTSGIPSEWIKVGQWRILNNIVCGGDTVSFYAVDSSEIGSLIKNLGAFSSQLPKDVVQTGEYIK